MASRFRKVDLWIALAALGALAVAIWAMVRAAKQVRMELIPPTLMVTPGRAGAYALLCIAVGAFTMALVQIWRTLIPVRGFFQRAALLRFLNKGLQDASFQGVPPLLWAHRHPIPDEVSQARALEEFELRGGRSAREGTRRGFWSVMSPMLYDLPIEQLCGQLNLAFDAALGAPSRFPNLLLGVLGREGIDPLAVVMQDSADVTYEDEKQRDIRLLHQAEARALLSRMGQQRIDAFQIDAGGAWRRLLRVCVVGMSLAFSWQATTYHPDFAALFERRVGLSRTVPSPFVSPSGGGAESGSGANNLTGSASDVRTNSVEMRDSVAQDDAQERQLWEDEAARGAFGTHLFQAILMGLISAYVAMALRDLAAVLELKRRQT